MSFVFDSFLSEPSEPPRANQPSAEAENSIQFKTKSSESEPPTASSVFLKRESSWLSSLRSHEFLPLPALSSQAAPQDIFQLRAGPSQAFSSLGPQPGLPVALSCDRLRTGSCVPYFLRIEKIAGLRVPPALAAKNPSGLRVKIQISLFDALTRTFFGRTWHSAQYKTEALSSGSLGPIPLFYQSAIHDENCLAVLEVLILQTTGEDKENSSNSSCVVIDRVGIGWTVMNLFGRSSNTLCDVGEISLGAPGHGGVEKFKRRTITRNLWCGSPRALQFLPPGPASDLEWTKKLTKAGDLVVNYELFTCGALKKIAHLIRENEFVGSADSIGGLPGGFLPENPHELPGLLLPEHSIVLQRPAVLLPPSFESDLIATIARIRLSQWSRGLSRQAEHEEISILSRILILGIHNGRQFIREPVRLPLGSSTGRLSFDGDFQLAKIPADLSDPQLALVLELEYSMQCRPVNSPAAVPEHLNICGAWGISMLAGEKIIKGSRISFELARGPSRSILHGRVFGFSSAAQELNRENQGKIHAELGIREERKEENQQGEEFKEKTENTEKTPKRAFSFSPAARDQFSSPRPASSPAVDFPTTSRSFPQLARSPQAVALWQSATITENIDGEFIKPIGESTQTQQTTRLSVATGTEEFPFSPPLANEILPPLVVSLSNSLEAPLRSSKFSIDFHAFLASPSAGLPRSLILRLKVFSETMWQSARIPLEVERPEESSKLLGQGELIARPFNAHYSANIPSSRYSLWCEYLACKSVLVDCWDSESLFLIGRASLPLREFLRAGEASKARKLTVEILESPGSAPSGFLSLTVSHQGFHSASEDFPSAPLARSAASVSLLPSSAPGSSIPRVDKKVNRPARVQAKSLQDGQPRLRATLKGAGALAGLSGVSLESPSLSSSLLERQANLRKIRQFRESEKAENVEKFLLGAITEERRICPSAGELIFLEVAFTNPFPKRSLVTVALNDPAEPREFSTVASSGEWSLMKKLYHLATPLNEAIFHRGSEALESPGEIFSRLGSCSILLEANETIFFPLKFQSFAAGEKGKENSTDLFPLVSGSSISPVPAISQRVAELRFLSGSFPHSLISFLKVFVDPQQIRSDRVWRFSHFQSEFLKGQFSIAATRRAEASLVPVNPQTPASPLLSGCRVICSRPDVSFKFSHSDDENHEPNISFQFKLADFPSSENFHFFVYGDSLAARLLAVHEVEAFAQVRGELTSTVGQKTRGRLFLPIESSGRQVFLAANDGAIEFDQPGRISKPRRLGGSGLEQFDYSFKSLDAGRRSVEIHLLDVDHRVLLFSWLIAVNNEAPVLSNTFALSLKPGQASRKTFEFSNPYAINKTFSFQSSEPDRVALRESSEIISLGPRERRTLHLAVQAPATACEQRVYLFVSDESGTVEESILFLLNTQHG